MAVVRATASVMMDPIKNKLPFATERFTDNVRERSRRDNGILVALVFVAVSSQSLTHPRAEGFQSSPERANWPF